MNTAVGIYPEDSDPEFKITLGRRHYYVTARNREAAVKRLSKREGLGIVSRVDSSTWIVSTTADSTLASGTQKLKVSDV